MQQLWIDRIEDQLLDDYGLDVVDITHELAGAGAIAVLQAMSKEPS